MSQNRQLGLLLALLLVVPVIIFIPYFLPSSPVLQQPPGNLHLPNQGFDVFKASSPSSNSSVPVEKNNSFEKAADFPSESVRKSVRKVSPEPIPEVQDLSEPVDKKASLDEPEPKSSLPIAISIFNNGQCTAILKNLGFLRDGDWIILTTGTFNNSINFDFLERCHNDLSKSGKDFVVALSTGNAGNLQEIAKSMPGKFEVMGSGYEPESPEAFTWDFQETLDYAAKINDIAHASGSRSILFPTGRPLRQASLANYGWDYGQVAGKLDALLIQTQGSVKSGVLDETLEKLKSSEKPLFLQITISPEGVNTNGVDVKTGIAAYNEMIANDFSVAIWWSVTTEGKAMLAEFLEAIRG